MQVHMLPYAISAVAVIQIDYITAKNYVIKMNSTEVQNPRRKLDVFGSKFLPVQSLLTVSEALLLPLRTLSLSFVTNNSSSDTKAFLRFIAFSGSQIAVHRDFLFFSDAKAWPQSQTDLFTCTTVLHCGHTFLRRIGYYTVGIPF